MRIIQRTDLLHFKWAMWKFKNLLEEEEEEEIVVLFSRRNHTTAHYEKAEKY